MYNSSNSRRKSPRLNSNAIILCSKYISEGKINTFKPSIEIQVVNISKEGLCICTPEVFKVGSAIEFDIILEGIAYKSMFAKIIWNIEIENTNKYGLNIQNASGKFSRHIHKLENVISINI